MAGFNSLTEVAIYLAGDYRGDEYTQLQHQLNYELSIDTFEEES